MFSSKLVVKDSHYVCRRFTINKYARPRFASRVTILLCLYCILTTLWLICLIPSSENTNSTLKPNEISTDTHWLVNTNVRHYNLSSNSLYHYEFRYQLLRKSLSNRLMLLLGEHKRTCSHWWTFSVGRRILSAMHDANYSILSVCSSRSTFDTNVPIEQNLDILWIYKSLHTWIHDIYYAKFQVYPLLYLYGLSHGSHFAGLLCRVLPIQAQILYLYPGHFQAMTTESKLDHDLQRRLTLDSSFASWFSFKYCYERRSDACILKNDKIQANFFPVPPTFFVHAANDANLNESNYKYLMSTIQHNAYQLGGRLLTRSMAIQLHISSPAKPTSTYMQNYFYHWHHKPHASQLFYEHLLGFPRLPEQQQSEYKYQTFWCHHADFTYFERYPLIMSTWSEKEQEDYRDYTNDIKTYHELLTEEFCGDLSAKHAMLSLELKQGLEWLDEINTLRTHLRSEELLSRPLRIWMYDKTKLVPKLFENHHQTANCSYNSYSKQMYLAESLVQKHFENSTTTENPLLADYFLIPHDLYCFIFFQQFFANFTNTQFKTHVYNYSQHYFGPLLEIVQYQFPYWTITQQPGSNHIVVFVGGRNMGVLDENVQRNLQNVIQLGPTGIRQDLLRRHAAELYLHRNLSTIYRHGYDIIIPPFTPTELQSLTMTSDWYERKRTLLFFAGVLNHSLSSRAARSLLDKLFAQNQTIRLTIEKKQFSLINLINGHVSTEEYLNAMKSSLFALCPEGYSPWTPRIYEAINLGSIPLILADGIVLPFERFIPWRRFTLKLNVTYVKKVVSFIIGDNHTDFVQRVSNKRQSVEQYKNAFRWLSHTVTEIAGNVFDYILRELKCRRLEQIFGASSDVHSNSSRQARQQVCLRYGDICPCPRNSPLAFDEYSYEKE